MFSMKTYGAPVTAAYNSSVNYEEGTGNPYLSPGLNFKHDIITNAVNSFRFLFAGWVTIKWE